MKEMQEKYFYERSFHERAFRFIREHKMLLPGERVAAGISGGADSVCLLFVLLKYAKKIPVSVGVSHVNHGLRADAGEDARYVE
ncbi:MAG: tRNA(Ile)-lysidine synthetase, partial [Acetatifactor sp.]|nr:tRNA(Ile)-lysidine synthetase [Acetatifactor sp.]